MQTILLSLSPTQDHPPRQEHLNCICFHMSFPVTDLSSNAYSPRSHGPSLSLRNDNHRYDPVVHPGDWWRVLILPTSSEEATTLRFIVKTAEAFTPPPIGSLTFGVCRTSILHPTVSSTEKGTGLGFLRGNPGRWPVPSCSCLAPLESWLQSRRDSPIR